jgi:mycothiol synthase
MSDPAYIIRNYRLEDFDKLVQLWVEVEKLRQACSCTSLQDLVESLGLPNHFPEKNLFVAEIGGNIVGYLDVMPELNIRRVVLSCLLHPEHRRKGFAKRLIERAVHRARELKVKIAHVNIPQESAMDNRLFSEMGFRFVRHFLELRMDLSEDHLLKINQIASTCRRLRRGEEDKLVQIQNRSFANTWGYSPNIIEEIIYRTSLPNCSPEDIILACDADKPIGYCWTKLNFGDKKAISRGKGRIYMLGVDPDHRGKGVGKQVLLASLFHLKSKGIRIVELTVDSENKTACFLYRSLGFEVHTSSLWYEKVLN